MSYVTLIDNRKNDSARYFYEGMNSLMPPDAIGVYQYQYGLNVTNRGGILQTRPGFKSHIEIDGEYAQGLRLFKSKDGLYYLVFAVDGKVYTSVAPFEEYFQLKNIQFKNNSRFIYWATCNRFVETQSDGSILQVNPYPVLMMQDGATKAAYWDSTVNRHLNPIFNETPVGTWMSWSIERLWVGRDKEIFVGDIGDPLNFTETEYLNEGGAFRLPAEITGFQETLDQGALYAFTYNNITAFDINTMRTTDRASWKDIPNIQKTLFSNLGCTAGRSIVSQYGTLWWMSQGGLVNLNTAFKSYQSSEIDYLDQEMMRSKSNMSDDQSGICGAGHENMLLMSVPSGHIKNKHTWALDQSIADMFNSQFPSSWSSVWTGIYPVEWAVGEVNGVPRCFCLSKDCDGKIRIWEAFQSDKTDNGFPITCAVEFRIHLLDSEEYKQFKYAEMYLTEVLGEVDLKVSYSGFVGGYKPILSKHLSAAKGIFSPALDINLKTELFGFKPQERNEIKTQEVSRGNNECSSCGVESLFTDNIDRGFNLLAIWSGRMGIRGYKIFAEEYSDQPAGRCEPNETGVRIVREDGCAGKDKIPQDAKLTQVFESTQRAYATCKTSGKQLEVIYTAESIISQLDADNKAKLASKAIATKQAEKC